MKFQNEAGLVNFVCIVFEIGDKMLTMSSMENLIVQCNHSGHSFFAKFKRKPFVKFTFQVIFKVQTYSLHPIPYSVNTLGITVKTDAK